MIPVPKDAIDEIERLFTEVRRLRAKIDEYERALDRIADLYERCMDSSALEISQQAYDMRCLARAVLGDAPKEDMRTICEWRRNGDCLYCGDCAHKDGLAGGCASPFGEVEVEGEP
jgi:hypothetical protein